MERSLDLISKLVKLRKFLDDIQKLYCIYISTHQELKILDEKKQEFKTVNYSMGIVSFSNPTPPFQLNHLHLEWTERNYLPICLFSNHLWCSCKVSMKSNEWFIRKLTYKACWWTDKQTGRFLLTPKKFVYKGIKNAFKI